MGRQWPIIMIIITVTIVIIIFAAHG
jgi:hypothetical protein